MIVLYRLKSMGYIHRQAIVPSVHPSIHPVKLHHDASKDVSVSHTFSALCTPADARQIALTLVLLNNICV